MPRRIIKIVSGGRGVFLLIFIAVSFLVSVNFELFSSIFLVSNGHYDYVSDHTLRFSLSGDHRWTEAGIELIESIRGDFALAKDVDQTIALAYRGQLKLPVIRGEVFSAEQSVSSESLVLALGHERAQEQGVSVPGKILKQYGRDFTLSGVVGREHLLVAENYKTFLNFGSLIDSEVLGSINGSYIFDAGETTKGQLGFLLQALSELYPGIVISRQGPVRIAPPLLNAVGQHMFSLISIALIVVLLSLNSYSLSALYISSRTRELTVKAAYGASKARLIFDLYRDIIPLSFIGFSIGFGLYLLARENGLWAMRRIPIQWQALLLAFLLSEGVSLLSQLQLFRKSVATNLAQYMRK